MPKLQKFTTEYVATEDRIRLSGEIENNGALVIWLTQRLLQRLIPVLTEWLEKQSPGKLPGEIVQSFAQQAARTALTPQEPVSSTTARASWLASSVDINRSAQAVRLTFRADDEQSAELPLNATHLRQWMGIVHDLHAAAGWPMNIWPEWIRPAAEPDLPKMLH